MKTFLLNVLILIIVVVSVPSSFAQVLYPDASVRLHEVWSRVADVYGELGSIESAEFSPDGRYIVSGSKFDNSVVMWRTSDGHEIWRNYAAQEIERVAWSSNGKYVTSCSEDHLVQLWDAESGELHENIQHNEGIDGLAWSNETMLLATGEEQIIKETSDGQTKEGWLKVYAYPGSKLVHEVDLGGTINEVKFSVDDKYLLATGHGFVKVFDTESWEELAHLSPAVFTKFTTADFTPDGKHIAAAGFGGVIYIWEWQEEKFVRSFNYRGRKVESLTWHPNNEYLITSGHGSYISIFRKSDVLSLEDDEVQVAAQVFANDGAEYIDFTRDGSFLVSAHQDGIIRLWVWKGENPNLNAQRHRWVSEQQKEANKN